MLATPDDVLRYGFDASAASKLPSADVRVRGYLAHRASAQPFLAGTRHVGLAELVVAIAHRMASTSPQVARGVTSESSMSEQVSFGSQAFAGVVDLTDAEKRRLDEMFPRAVRSTETFK